MRNRKFATLSREPSMQLTGEEISGLVDPASDSRVRAASYDLGIGLVMLKGKRHQYKVPTLDPQQMAVFVSEERVRMPPGYVGYVLPKTGLCQEGILTLSTGIIDPGWEGHISTIAINFDRRPAELEMGDAFLRVVVHRLNNEEAVDSGTTPADDASYLKNRQADSRLLPNTFLDLKKHIKEIADEVTKSQINWFLGALAVASVLIIVFTNVIGPYLSDYDSEIDDLRDRVRELEMQSATNAQEPTAQLDSRITQPTGDVSGTTSGKPADETSRGQR